MTVDLELLAIAAIAGAAGWYLLRKARAHHRAASVSPACGGCTGCTSRIAPLDKTEADS